MTSFNKVRYSVIIPTLNGANRIHHPLYALLRQSLPPESFEIIVVDDGSIDDTKKVIQGFVRGNPSRRIRYLHQSNKGPASARNLGINYAKGDIIFFTDDDCEPPATWMELMLKIYQDYPEVVGVAGWYGPTLYEAKTDIYHQFMYVHYHLYWGWPLDFYAGKNTDAPYLPFHNTANISYKKWVLQKIGGFDTRFPFAMEDTDLSGRIRSAGYPIYYLPVGLIHHKDMNLRRFLRWAKLRGQGRYVYEYLKNPRYKRQKFIPAVLGGTKSYLAYIKMVESEQPAFKFDKRLTGLILLYNLVYFLGERRFL